MSEDIKLTVFARITRPGARPQLFETEVFVPRKAGPETDEAIADAFDSLQSRIEAECAR